MSAAGGSPPAGDAVALEAALAAAGVRAAASADGRLALLVAPPDTFASASARDAATRLARASGFTHAALVLWVGDPDPAAPAPADAARTP